MSQINSNISYTGLVEKYIGSAYDNVKLVAANMEGLLEILAFIESPDYPYLVDLGKHIEQFLQDIKDYQSSYYGSLPAHPTEDPFGNPPTPGDMYFNETEQYLFAYNGYDWYRLGVINQVKERRIVQLANIEAPWALLTTKDPYVVGSNNLAVYVNGNHQLPSTAEQPGDFVEIDSHTFKIYESIAPPGAVVDTTIGTEVANISHMLDVDVYQVFTYIANQTEISLPAGVSYTVGTNQLEVFINRRLQLVDIEYTEATTQSIILVTPLAMGVEVVFRVGHLTGTLPDYQKVVMQSLYPDPEDYEAGRFWLNTNTLRLYILYADADSKQWISVSGEEDIVYPDTPPVIQPPEMVPIVQTIFQPTQPNPDFYPQGTQWFKTDSGELFILYSDIDSNQWLKVSAA